MEKRKKKTAPRKKAAGKKAPAKKAAPKPRRTKTTTGFTKRYLKRQPACRVTFRLPGKAAPEAAQVNLVGDFNNWDCRSLPMKRLKSGDFTLTLPLQKDRSYRFRYLIDGENWENDWSADRYEANCFGTEDSVVEV